MTDRFIFMLALNLGLLGSTTVWGTEHADLPMPGNSPRAQLALRDGAQMFFHYCVACHSLKYMRYSRIATDLRLSEPYVMRHLNFTGARFNDPVISRMPAALARRAFGKASPDLSLEVSARGADWVYAYLDSFYLDPNSPTGWNNTILPHTSMPFPLSELQGTQTALMSQDGQHVTGLRLRHAGSMTPARYRQATADLVDFLTYVSEPAVMQRRHYGIWVMLFLVLFVFLAWLLKTEYWKDIH